MIKLFEENYKPIQVKLKNVNGKEFDLTIGFMTSEKTRELEELWNDQKTLSTDKVLKMMETLFNKDKKFFGQFSLDLLGQVAEYFREESKKNDRKTDGSTESSNSEGSDLPSTK